MAKTTYPSCSIAHWKEVNWSTNSTTWSIGVALWRYCNSKQGWEKNQLNPSATKLISLYVNNGVNIVICEM